MSFTCAIDQGADLWDAVVYSHHLSVKTSYTVCYLPLKHPSVRQVDISSVYKYIDEF